MRSHCLAASALAAALFGANIAQATTWFDSQVDDPLAPGETCAVKEWGSYGGYIYDWPSKYDQVFWPYTDDAAIWYCKSSGFAAFVHDFKLTPAEIERVTSYLKGSAATANAADPARLKLVEALYGLRDKDPHFRVFLLRLLAYKYEQLENLDAATAYRTRALAAMQAALTTDVDEHTRLEYVYVCANYARKLGDTKRSDEYLEQLHRLAANATPKEGPYAKYLEKLSADTPKIAPGGKLAPERRGPIASEDR